MARSGPLRHVPKRVARFSSAWAAAGAGTTSRCCSRAASTRRSGRAISSGGRRGFEMTLSRARRRVAAVSGSGKQRRQNIAVDDLETPDSAAGRAADIGQVFDVGSDDVLSADEMIDTAAAVLARPKLRKTELSALRFRLSSGFIGTLGQAAEGFLPRTFLDGRRHGRRDQCNPWRLPAAAADLPGGRREGPSLLTKPTNDELPQGSWSRGEGSRLRGGGTDGPQR